MPSPKASALNLFPPRVAFVEPASGRLTREAVQALRDLTRFLEALAPVVNVRMYGAVGGGDVDDTEAFAAALLAIRGMVRLPDPVYRIGSVALSGFDGLSGDLMMGAQIYTTGITVAGSFTEISNVRLETESSPNYALTYADDGFNNFGNWITAMRVRGPNGMDIGSIETKIQQCFGVGAGWSSSGIGINIRNWDTSVDNVLLQDYGVAVKTNRGIQANDLHVVRSARGLDIREGGHPTQLINSYIDTIKHYGVYLHTMQGAAVVNAHVLNIGDASTASDATGFMLISSPHNKLLNVHFQQADAATYQGGIAFDAVSINNLLLGFSGSYKLSANATQRIRNQTVIGCQDGWARHNNVPRAMRANAASVATSAQAVLTFLCDWEYPAPSENLFLFRGTWVARHADSTGAYGEIFVSIADGAANAPPTITTIAGDGGITWSVISAVLSGTELTLTLENNSSAAGSIAVELVRSVDAKGITF